MRRYPLTSIGEPSLEEPDYGPEDEIDPYLEYLAGTPEGLEWEPVEEGIGAHFATRLAEILAAIHEEERARAIWLRTAA